MIKLSKLQSEIVNFPIDSSIQVLASAGSGKTRVLTERVRHIIQHSKKDGIIALTFTNKAAEEMQDRLDDLDDLNDRVWISTIHGVAQRILEQYSQTIGLPSELHIYERDQDRKTVFLQSLRDSGIDVDEFLQVSDHNYGKDREKKIQNYMNQFSTIKRELLSIDEIREKYIENERFLMIYNEYQSALLESGGIDFDDILVYAHKILLEQSWCGDIYRAKYKHICVDEAQDLNKAQYEFIKLLFGETSKSLFMVGDPDQMIYGFNGSSHKYLCESFVSEFSPQQFSLKQNYRSSKSVISLANKIKPGSQVESDFALDGLKDIQSLESETDEAMWVVDNIKNLIDLKTHSDIEGDIGLDKMVIIARNRFIFNPLIDLLKQENIPYKLKKGESQVEPSSLFGKVLDLTIRLKTVPKDWVDGKKLCKAVKINSNYQWCEEGVLLAISEQVRLSKDLYKYILADLISHIHELEINDPNVPKLCKVFKERLIEISSSYKNQNEIEVAIQDLIDFRKSWTIFKRKGLGDSLMSFRNAMALGQLIEHNDTYGLTLSTVHTMKGLERDIVFIIGMCEGVFPDYRANSNSEIEEERNNAFVAITRSRRWIYISYPKSRMMPWGDSKYQQPSRFLTELRD